jgi:uncharacterized protein (TIGR03435 family)
VKTILVAVALSSLVFGQTVPATPAFEVADIKPSADAMPGKGRLLPGGRIEMPGASLIDLIRFAYGVQENMITGAPKWAATDRFDIVAKAGTDVPIPTISLMMQGLLAERFKLTFHREEKPMSTYVLKVGTRPAKYQQGAGGRQDCNWSTLESGLARRTCHNLSMPELARQLPGWGGIGIDAPVVDQTGLAGAYDFQLDVGMRRGNNEGARSVDGNPNPAIIAESGPTIFQALEQIGLKLESRKMPLSVIVIDRAEKP